MMRSLPSSGGAGGRGSCRGAGPAAATDTVKSVVRGLAARNPKRLPRDKLTMATSPSFARLMNYLPFFLHGEGPAGRVADCMRHDQHLLDSQEIVRSAEGHGNNKYEPDSAFCIVARACRSWPRLP